MKQFSTVKEIPINQIMPNPNQPRKAFNTEAIEELAQSIRVYGVIQPVTVRKTGMNRYELVSGERRVRAAKKAGLVTVPSIITALTDEDSAVIAIVENIQREDLNYFEEAQSYKQLMETYQMTQEKIAKMLGKSQSFIANKLRLLKLDPTVIAVIRENGLTERHARSLLRISNRETQLDVVNQVAREGLNVKKTEALVEERISQRDEPDNTEKKSKQKKKTVKSLIDVQIYINTIKNAFKMVKESKADALYTENVKDDCVEITIKLPR